MALYQSITQLIGNTPLLQLNQYMAQHHCVATLLAKLEGANPAGSAKDRIALAMIEQAEQTGLLPKGGTIIEPTSGNTGIGLAAIGAYKGYSVILTMPDTMSVERQKLLLAYGAKVVLTPGRLGMQGAIDKAMELQNTIPHSILASQFDNPANPNAHYATTGPEIWKDTNGQVDILVAGVGTGGTLSGAGKYLKEQNPNLQIIAVEPADSPVLSGGKAGVHGIQGIGANFIPKTAHTHLFHQIMQVKTQQAYTAARNLVAKEGILVGISSGAALHAATWLAQQKENAHKTIVVILPDTGERYLSTPLFQSE